MVPDADAAHARAVAAGAQIIRPLQDTPYGSREFGVKDPEGHTWTVGTYDPWAARTVPLVGPVAAGVYSSDRSCGGSPLKISICFGSFALLSLALIVSAALAQARPGCWWPRRATASLAIVDPAAGKLLASVAEGGMTGHEVAASPDGKLAYVPIYGNSGVGKPGTDGTQHGGDRSCQRKVVGNVDFGHGVRPHCPVFGPKDGLLYVTTELDQTITVIDPKTLKIVGSIPTGQAESHMLAISHDGRRGYTANVGPGTVRCWTWRRAKR